MKRKIVIFSSLPSYNSKSIIDEEVMSCYEEWKMGIVHIQISGGAKM